MRKHNRDHRRLVALTNFYRRHTPEYIAIMRDQPSLSWRMAKELRALESRLSPELVAWAKINV